MDGSSFQSSDPKRYARSSSDHSEEGQPKAQLCADVLRVIDKLPSLENGELLEQIFETLVRMAEQEAERLDWKILSHSLLDMEEGFKSFFLTAIFGRLPSSARPAQQVTSLSIGWQLSLLEEW